MRILLVGKMKEHEIGSPLGCNSDVISKAPLVGFTYGLQSVCYQIVLKRVQIGLAY